ncbi:GTP--adenosylcobinamide-phosphate guanylyltransferase, partial [Halobacteriales archaeon QS_6_71_20]
RTTFVVSPHAPATREHLAGRAAGASDSAVVDAPGDGYVADLGYALDRVGTPTLTVAADLPLLTADAVDGVCAAFSGDSLAVHVTAVRKRRLGASVDTTRTVGDRELAPTGLNVVADGEREETLVVEDDRLAVNVNRPRDARVAAALLRVAAGEPGAAPDRSER